MDPKALVRELLERTAVGPFDALKGKVADDFVLRLPYAPPGAPNKLRGFARAKEVISGDQQGKQSFAWHDVVTLQTEDPELFVTTARSEVVMRSGQPYANDYIMLTRIRYGVIVEHCVYFNPLPLVKALGQDGKHPA